MVSLNKAMVALFCCVVIGFPAKRVMMAELLSVDANDQAEKQNVDNSTHEKTSDVARKTSQDNGCSTISKEVRGMWAAGAKNWEGVYKCQHQDGRVVLIQCDMDDVKGVRQAACWVKDTQKPDELTQFLNGVTGVITSVADTIASLVMPTTKTKADLDTAIAKFAGSDQATAAKLHLELDGKWNGLNPFEKEFTVSVLSSVSESSLLELSDVSVESEAEVEDLEGENFFTFLLKLIAALFKSNARNNRRAAANHYMSMNIGWDHVRSNMRRDGWRW